MTLFRAERRRLVKRRLTRYMLIIGILVLGAVAVGTWFTNHKVGPAEIAAAEQQAEAQYQQNLRIMEQIRADCERGATGGVPDAKFGGDCSNIQPPPREAFEARWFLRQTFNFKASFEGTITVFAGILALIAFVVGASFVGAEWHTGGMMNLLLWRPRRLQVLFGKLATLLVGTLAVTVVLGGLWTAAFWLIAKYRGTTARMTPGTWRSLELTGIRALALILVAAALGFGIASAGRHTAMALGTAIGVGVVGFVGVGVALSLIGVKFLDRYLWPTYLRAWMDKKTVLENYDSCDFSFTQGACAPKTVTITWQDSGTIFAVVLVAVLAFAFWSMRRRDVT